MKRLKVLVPVDFSALSRGALAHALGSAAKTPFELHVVHVVDDRSDGRASSEPAVLAHWLFELERTVSTVVDDVIPDAQGRARLGELQHHLIAGDPATEIARLAVQRGIRVIVMGTHGRGGSRRLPTGSVAQSVVRLAPCSIVLVGPGETVQSIGARVLTVPLAGRPRARELQP